MKSAAIVRFRERLQRDELLTGLWMTLEATAIADISAGLGLDWIIVDAHGGHPHWPMITECVRATRRSQTAVLIRLREISRDQISWVLEAGVDGLLVSTGSPSQLKDVVEWANISAVPGYREDRANIGQPAHRKTTTSTQRPLIFAAPMHADQYAVERLVQMDGIDAILLPSAEADKEELALENTIGLIRAAGKRPVAIATSDHEIERFHASGVRVICLGVDRAILFSELSGVLAVASNSGDGSHDQAPPGEILA